MADAEIEIRANYEKNLKAEDYVTQMGEHWKKAPIMLRFMIQHINDVASSGRFKGSKLLEIGCGATVHSIANASAYYSNIVMSDYVQDNLDHLNRWLRQESTLKQFLEIPAEVEGYGKDLETGIKVLESRIRNTVKRVTRCDVLSDGIFLHDDADSPDTTPPFDLIISVLTLVASPKDLESLAKIFKRINSLLRPGGGLVVIDFLKGGGWHVNEIQFNYILVTQEELMDCLQMAGFGNIEAKLLRKEDLEVIDYEFDGLVFVSAEKL